MEKSTKIKTGCGIAGAVALLAGILRARSNSKKRLLAEALEQGSDNNEDVQSTPVNMPPLGKASKPSPKNSVKKSPKFTGSKKERRRKMREWNAKNKG